MFQYSKSYQFGFECFFQRFVMFLLTQKICFFLNLDFSGFEFLLLALTQGIFIKTRAVFLADIALTHPHR